MILYLAKFIARLFGIDTTRAQLIVIGGICLFNLIAFGLLVKQCESCAVKRNQQQIDRKDAEIGNANTGLQIANQAAQNANNASINAEQKANEIKNANYSNSANAGVLKNKAERFERR